MTGNGNNGDSGIGPADEARSQADSTGSVGGWKWAVIVVSLIAVAAVAVIVVFMGQKADLEADLEEAQRQATEFEAGKAQAEEDRNRVQSQLGAANSRANDAVQRAADAESRAEEAESRAEGAASRAELADALEDGVIELMGASFSFAAGISEEDGRCVAESLVSQVGSVAVMRAVVQSLTNPFAGEQLEEEAEIAAEECGVDIGPGIEAGDTYGDNPTLDVLWDACADGDGAACDRLYEISELGSDYERFGGTCGDRYATIFDAPLRCEGEI